MAEDTTKNTRAMTSDTPNTESIPFADRIYESSEPFFLRLLTKASYFLYLYGSA